MKRYEDKTTKVVTERECVELRCDLCDAKAEYPENECFEWGGAGLASAKLKWQYTIDGECERNKLDLCYECGDAIGEAIRHSQKKLLALIGRSEA